MRGSAYRDGKDSAAQDDAKLRQGRPANLPTLQRSHSAKQNSSTDTAACDAAASRRASADGDPRVSSITDIDSGDKSNPQTAHEYAAEIYTHFHKIEARYLPPSTYMNKQPEISPWMRGVLVDWLVEVHLKFKLMPETLYLTVNVVDRYLALKPVKRKELQLVGVAAMFLASKYEEIWSPEVRDFVYICDKAYTRQQIVEMERNVCIALGFMLTLPTSYHFVARYMKASGYIDQQFGFLCGFLLELALPDYDMLHYTYSQVAAAAVTLALKIADRKEQVWLTTCQDHSGHSVEHLKPVIAKLQHLVVQAAQPDADMRAVYKKYSSSKYGEVTRLWKTRPALFCIEDACNE